MTAAAPDFQSMGDTSRSRGSRSWPRSGRSNWDKDSATDALFALASVASITGLEVPGIGAPIFTVFVAAIALVSARNLLQVRTLGAFPPPLVVFLLIHLASAFRVSPQNGLVFVIQAAVVCLFAWAFVTRYSRVSVRRYLAYTGLGMLALAAYVLVYHWSLGKYTSFKLLDDPKAVFSLLPVMLLVLRLNNARSSKYLFAVLMPLFVAVVLMSGERKAYILLALVAPFLINFRSLTTYVAVLVAALAVPLALVFDKSGYVELQLSTLSSFAQGEVQATVSNDLRAEAIEFARELFNESPIVGVGTNGYADAYNSQFGEFIGPHNEWLRVAAENGIVGLFFYAATVFWGFVGLFRLRVGERVRSTREKLIAFALFATFVTYVTFEALDLVVVLAFCLTPLVQYLRLDPDDRVTARHGYQRRIVGLADGNRARSAA